MRVDNAASMPITLRYPRPDDAGDPAGLHRTEVGIVVKENAESTNIFATMRLAGFEALPRPAECHRKSDWNRPDSQLLA